MTEYIDREGVAEFTKGVFGGLAKHGLLDKGEEIIAERYLDIINGYPAADVVEVVHGRWVKTGQSFLFPERFRNYSCSVCGHDIDKTKYNYCPNCGAEMQLEEWMANKGEEKWLTTQR